MHRSPQHKALSKETPGSPFVAPKAEIAAIKANAFDAYASPELGTLRVDFPADLDITGRNSGSPARGASSQLVGLAPMATASRSLATGCSIRRSLTRPRWTRATGCA